MLNEFEIDSSESILRDKEYNLDKLNNYKIAIIAHENSKLAKYILNMCEFIGNKIELYANIVTIPSLKEIKDNSLLIQDYQKEIEKHQYNSIIYTGIIEQEYMDNLNVNILEEVEHKLTCISSFILQFIRECDAHNIVCLSDYKAYGNSKKRTKVSELEIMPNDNSCIALLGQAIRSMENTILHNSINIEQRKCIILRLGTIIAPHIKCNNSEINSVLTAIIDDKSISVNRTLDKVSCIYINDILRSICYALTEFKSGVYNVAGKDASVSIGELVELLYNNFPNRMKIQLTNANETVSVKENKMVELNCSKIKYVGFVPKVSLEDALVLKIKSELDTQEEFVFDNTYQGKLDTIHEILLGLVLEIDKICKKNNIKYFLAGGTLLGAIRHGKFIPWDDDVDVMMLREDYDHFLKIVKDDLPEWLFLQTPQTDKASHSVFTRIRINDTMFATEFTSRFENMHNGIFLDVVCHDKTANSKFMQKCHIFFTLLTRSMVFNKWKKAPIKLDNRFKILCGIATLLKNILPMRLLEFIQDKTISFYKNYNKSKYLYDGMGRNIRRGAFPSYYLDETIEIDFKGKKLPVPKEYDKYLTYLYGDYMKMVPVSERRTSHSIEIMDLGEYIDYKIDK